jgi:nucleotide-binding universal stress UspA family protein
MKIIWAVDPYAAEAPALKSAAWALRALTKGISAEIEPIYVVGLTPFDVPLPTTTKVVASLREKGQDELDLVLLRVKLKGMRPLRVITSTSLSQREDASALLDYARDAGASLIVLSSHGRKGVPRFFLGSFAETVALKADVPIFVVHPGIRRAPELKQIVFATDFSEESLNAFASVLEFAKGRKSRVIIYHRLGIPSYLTLEPVYLPADLYQQEYDDYRKSIEARGKDLVEQATLAGVKADFDLARRGQGSVAEGIIRLAKRLDAMIAVASQSGAVTSALLGSTTRQLMRGSEQPVWVIHPKASSISKPAQGLRGLPGGQSQSEPAHAGPESSRKDQQRRIL